MAKEAAGGDDSSIRQIFAKALTKKAEWTDKDDLLDVLYWLRQSEALLLGIVWGLIPLKGLFALVLYVAISTLTGHLYVTSYQEQEDEEYGGFWELAKEGFGAAIATFLVSWICLYTLMHAPEVHEHLA
ncbi:Rab5-interacting protein [Aphelenchoides fujianensis]|nr:Rab5-interacting protein [Aphelenchoides fujianensis]